MNEMEVELNTEDQSFNKIKTLMKEAYKLIDQRKYKDAKDKLVELLVTDPNNTYGLVGMGDLLYKTQNYEESIKYYKTCLTLDTSINFPSWG